MNAANPLLRAWLMLLALSGATALLASEHARLPKSAGAVLLLLLAFSKARIILDDYLGLRAAPAWRRGFTVVILLFLAGLAALYLAR